MGDGQHLRCSPLARTADVVELGCMLGRDPALEWVASSLRSRHTMRVDEVWVLLFAPWTIKMSDVWPLPSCHLPVGKRARSG